MNNLLYLVSEIKHQIPNDVLTVAFIIDEVEESVNLTSLDEKIIRKLIKKRVLMDANIIGGIETIIPLFSLTPSYFREHYSIYQIPPYLTNNKEIVSALNLTYMPGTAYFSHMASNSTFFHPANNFDYTNPFFTLNYGNPITNVAGRIGSAAHISGVITNAHIEIVGYNTLLIYANYRSLSGFGVRVVLENDSNFSNIQPRSLKALSYLCVLACKSFIYNRLIIPVNKGFIFLGHELGVFKEIVDSYSGAEEEYRTYLKEVWGAVATMNDTTRYNRFLASLISPGV